MKRKGKNLNFITFFWVVIFCYVIIFFSYQIELKAKTPHLPRIQCNGFILETKENIPTEKAKSVIQKILNKKKFGDVAFESIKSWDKKLIISIVLKDQSYKNIQEMIPIRKELLTNIFQEVDYHCEFHERLKINQQPLRFNGLNDEFCINLAANQITNNKKYFSCDPRWPLKITGILKLDHKNHHSKDWFDKNHQTVNKGTIGIIGHDYFYHPEMGINPVLKNHSMDQKPPRCPSQFFYESTSIALIKSPKDRQLAGFINEGPTSHYIEGLNENINIHFFKSDENLFSIIKILNSIISKNLFLDALVIKKDFPLPSEILRNFIRKFNKRGGVIVAPVSDDIEALKKEMITITFPAQYDETLAVSGINTYGNPYPKSGYGTAVDFSAPSEDIFTLAKMNKDNLGQFGIIRSSSNLYAGTISAGILSLFFNQRTDELSHFKYNKNDLIRYLLLYLDKTKNQNLFCDQLPSSCENISFGLYGQGILNIESLMKTPIPPIENFKDWVKVDDDFAPLSGKEIVIKNFFTDFSIFIQKARISIEFWVGIFMKLFDIRSEEGLIRFLNQNGANIVSLTMDNLDLQNSLIRYWELEEAVFDLNTQFSNKMVPDFLSQNYELQSKQRRTKIAIFGHLYPFLDLPDYSE